MAELQNGRRDETIRSEIINRLESYPRIGNLHLPIEVQVQDGCVTLHGWARTAPQREAAGRLAAGVPGVRALENRVIADDDLSNQVGVALANDRRLRRHFPGMVITCSLGQVTLSGYVETEADRQAAETLAASVPGVQEVKNRLEVAPDKLVWLQK